VVRELQEIETASFRKDSPEVRSGEFRMEDIGTEVFLMPAATHIEKEGCFTNTERLVQWRDKALDPPVDCRSDLWFMHHLFKRVRAHYADSTASRDWPIQNLTWDYPEHGEHAEPSADAVLREINGYEVATGELVPGFAQLANDGSTACGYWIYSGIYADGVNQARPWSERKKYVGWDEEQRKWTGYDVPDFPVDKPPDYVAPPDAKGMDAISGSDPFIMQADGRGLAVRSLRLLDGPMPTHYEPLESPVHNRLYPGIDESPAALRWDRADNPVAETADPRWPLVATTFRLTEHHTAGGMSRWLPWLAELQPEMFAEIDPELARDRGIADGDWMTISSPRAEIEARARVTDRIKPLRLGDRVTHQVGLPGTGASAGRPQATRPTRQRHVGRSERRHPGVQGVRVRRAGGAQGEGPPARSPASTTRRPA
jgi:formate dehydrogenase major subunit